MKEAAMGQRRGGGIFHFFCHDVHCDLFAAGVEPDWAAWGELR